PRCRPIWASPGRWPCAPATHRPATRGWHVRAGRGCWSLRRRRSPCCSLMPTRPGACTRCVASWCMNGPICWSTCGACCCGLARLRQLSPTVRIWGLSATLGNLSEARDVLLPQAQDAALISGGRPRRVTVRTLMPERNAALPWAGHLGLSQLGRVYKSLFAVRSSLLFTNTRAQAELWHRALESIWLEDPATLALHHGSLDPKLRTTVEPGLREGRIRGAVATSSLDLGVDFPAVDQVLQVGSPKGVARIMQRAGRARHRPGEAGQVVCVPAQALELFEYAAARQAITRGDIEPRRPLRAC